MPGRSPDDTDPAVGSLSTPASALAPAVARKGPRQVRSGDTLGRYELGDELGEGGMATVFRARDRELRRDVAVKVLFPHLARRTEIVHRFHREARAAAGLEHPNILRIYDVGGGEGDDPPHIVMELIRGRTLLQEIEQRGAMLAEVAACIGALLADALAAAHAAGVIHRDIKPANVLIAPGGRLLLADFGVARLETDDSLVTRTGALLGTPAYMSPEQASGDIATAQSDLYSLGATLYQLATGALPYGGSPAKVMSLIATGGLVAPVRRRAACGADLSRLIERLMAADPGARPSSATAIAAELRALAADGGLGDASEELAAYFEDPDGFLRTRTPTVVSALIGAARTAMAGSRLPRAMALADRASALTPDDPAVVALVEAVTDGGRAATRRRRFAIAGVALVLAGGATVGGWQLSRWSEVARASDAERAALAIDGAGSAAADAALAVSPSVSPPVLGDTAPPLAAVPIDAAVAAETARLDAGIARPAATRAAPAVRGAPVDRAGGSLRAAGSAAAPDSAAPIDAAPAREPEPTSPPPAATGHLIVRNDIWCNIWIDDVDRGNRRNEPIEVAAGHHVVRCVNPSGKWTQETDVPAGATRTLTGSLLQPIEVRLEVDATINGRHYRRGAVVKLKAGNFEVIVDGNKQFITLRSSCVLRDQPSLGCYP